MWLKDFTDRLPRYTGSRLTEELIDPSLALNLQFPVGYVWPDLETDDPTPAQVLLISAPGAMGKSMAARALAAELNAPYICHASRWGATPSWDF
jgi:hypothetical protein